MNSIELRQNWQSAVDEAANMISVAEKEQRDLTEEENTQWEAVCKRAEDLKTQIAKEEKKEYVAKAQSELQKPIKRSAAYPKQADKKDFNLALRGWLMGGSRRVPSNLLEAAEACNIDVHNPQLDLGTRATVYGETTTDSTYGAKIVPTELVNQLFVALKKFGGMNSVAQVIETTDGHPLLLPNTDPTALVGGIIAEGQPNDDTIHQAFDQTSFGAYLYDSGTMQISLQLIQDSIINVEQFISQALFTSLARAMNTDFTTGDGSGDNPRGICQDANVTVSESAYTYENLLGVIAGLDPAYMPNAKWMMHSKTWVELAKLVDGNSRPLLWNYATDMTNQVFAPNLLGFPVVLNQSMPTTTSKTTIVLADFSRYVIRQVANPVLIRFNELYLKNNTIGLCCRTRADGKLVEASQNSDTRCTSAFELTAVSP